MKKVLLIDADILIFKAAFVSEHGVAWDTNSYTLQGDLAQAKCIFKDKVITLLERLEADVAVCFITGKKNFRKEVNPDYKSNRATQFRPILLPAMREWLESEDFPWKTIQIPELEADDAINIYSKGFNREEQERIIVSIDKDFASVCLPWYHLDKEILFPAPTPDQAERFLCLQTLAGDKTDGYDGIPGVGIKSAEKLLDAKEGKYWSRVVQIYEEKGLTKKEAFLNTWMARFVSRKQWKEKKLFGGIPFEKAIEDLKLWRQSKQKQEF